MVFISQQWKYPAANWNKEENGKRTCNMMRAVLTSNGKYIECFSATYNTSVTVFVFASPARFSITTSATPSPIPHSFAKILFYRLGVKWCTSRSMGTMMRNIPTSALSAHTTNHVGGGKNQQSELHIMRKKAEKNYVFGRRKFWSHWKYNASFYICRQNLESFFFIWFLASFLRWPKMLHIFFLGVTKISKIRVCLVEMGVKTFFFVGATINFLRSFRRDFSSEANSNRRLTRECEEFYLKMFRK